MIRKFTLLILFGLIVTGCSSSKDLNIWTKQTKIDEVKKFESELNSDLKLLDMNVSLSKSIFPRVKEFNLANPLIVPRKKSDFLPVYAEYFYSKTDSILRYVSYNWERNRYGNFDDKKKDWKNQNSKLEKYDAEYHRIKVQLIEQFGLPNEQDVGPLKDLFEHGSGGPDYFSRNTIWETNKRYMKLNMIFGGSTYRIRLYYYWK